MEKSSWQKGQCWSDYRGAANPEGRLTQPSFAAAPAAFPHCPVRLRPTEALLRLWHREDGGRDGAWWGGDGRCCSAQQDKEDTSSQERRRGLPCPGGKLQLTRVTRWQLQPPLLGMDSGHTEGLSRAEGHLAWLCRRALPCSPSQSVGRGERLATSPPATPLTLPGERCQAGNW